MDRAEGKRALPTVLVEKEVTAKALPENLVEKIVAMMPFPYIFKGRTLSKSWLARFSSISSLDDDAQKSLAISFQKQVGEWSHNWETFCLAFFTQDDSFGYDRASGIWRRMPPLSFLPPNLLSRSDLQIEGSPLFLIQPFDLQPFYINGELSGEEQVHVANILTRTSKPLPRPPSTGRDVIFCHKFVCDSSNAYKVILFCQAEVGADFEGFSVKRYDSETEVWSCTEFPFSSDLTLVGSSYLNGVLYMLAKNPLNLLSFNLEEKSHRVELGAGLEIHIIHDAYLVDCNSGLLMIVENGPPLRTGLQVFKVDLPSRRLLQLAQGPPAALRVGRMDTLAPVTDSKCIYFGLANGGKRVLAYLVDEDEWTCFPLPTLNRGIYQWIGSSFQVPFSYRLLP